MRRLLAFLIIAGLICFGVFWWITSPNPLVLNDVKLQEPNISNGAYMFHAGGCASCHAAPDASKSCDRPGYPTGAKLGGGRCLKTDFGTFYVPNLSPHKTMGIGGWSQLDFLNAMKRGLGPDGSHYYPAFPFTSYAKMKNQDVVDLFAFIKTLPEDATPSKAHEVSFPFSWRRMLGGWKWLFLDTSSFSPEPGLSPELNRGRYLVEGPGHCAECHSPRNILGGIITSKRHAGGPAAEGEGKVPNITQHIEGLKKWSVSDIVYALQSGFTPDFDTLGGTMAKVQENMSKLTKADQQAIAKYLKSLKPAQ